MPLRPDEALAEAISALARVRHDEETVRTTLQLVAAAATHLIEAVEEVGVTINADRPMTDAATGGVVFEVDNFQYDAGQGPCLHALLTDEVVEIPSMAADQRWPTYARFAVERGIHASLSLPLTIEDEVVGVMNLYAMREEAFGAEDRLVATAFAEHAACALANARAFEHTRETITQLQEGLVSRATIEQAKGILMERHQIKSVDAFDRLRSESQR